MNRTAVLRCLAAAALFGASTPAASTLAGDTSPLVIAGLLYLGAAVAVAPSTVREPPSLPALRQSWRPLITAVVAGGALGPALLVAGLARVDAASASILLNLELVATVAIAAAFFHEHIGRKVFAGAALVTAGGVLLVWEPGADLSTGALLVAAACVCWGLDNCVTASIDHVSPQNVVLFKGLVAGSANLILGLLLVGDPGIGLTATQVLAALAIGALGYGLSITLWVKGARDLGAARGQIIFATAPFLGALIAWTVLGELTTVPQIVAILLAGCGVLLSLESAHQHEHQHQPTSHEHEHRHDDGHHDHPHPARDSDRPHSHPHDHQPVLHTHPHLPDLHHRHSHSHS
jgi:drug/metabolite transporter (DMT)-like permease